MSGATGRGGEEGEDLQDLGHWSFEKPFLFRRLGARGTQQGETQGVREELPVCQVQEGSSSTRGRSPRQAHSIHRCSASHGQLAGLPAHLQEVDTCSREDVTKYLGLLCLLTVFVLFQKASHHLSHTQKPPGFHKLSLPVVFGDGQDGGHFSALSLTVQSEDGSLHLWIIQQNPMQFPFEL